MCFATSRQLLVAHKIAATQMNKWRTMQRSKSHISAILCVKIARIPFGYIEFLQSRENFRWFRVISSSNSQSELM